jgi:DNA polymerase elongation subunit (family B)
MDLYQEISVGWSWTILYGDTDSILSEMVEPLTLDQVQAKLIPFNARFKHIHVAAQQLISRVYMVTKKTYAMKKDEQAEWEVKGLIMIRRNMCPFAKRLGYEWLNWIFSEAYDPMTAVDSIQGFIRDVRTVWLHPNHLVVEDFIMYQHFFEEKTPLTEPHGIVARRWNDTHPHDRFISKDWVPYVRTRSGPKHPSETKIEELDLAWYVYKCFQSITSQLLEPLQVPITDEMYRTWWSDPIPLDELIPSLDEFQQTWSQIMDQEVGPLDPPLLGSDTVPALPLTLFPLPPL